MGNNDQKVIDAYIGSNSKKRKIVRELFVLFKQISAVLWFILF